MRCDGPPVLDKRFLGRYSERHIRFDTAGDNSVTLPQLIAMLQAAMFQIENGKLFLTSPKDR
jgi:hypothetical protein